MISPPRLSASPIAGWPGQRRGGVGSPCSSLTRHLCGTFVIGWVDSCQRALSRDRPALTSVLRVVAVRRCGPWCATCHFGPLTFGTLTPTQLLGHARPQQPWKRNARICTWLRRGRGCLCRLMTSNSWTTARVSMPKDCGKNCTNCQVISSSSCYCFCRNRGRPGGSSRWPLVEKRPFLTDIVVMITESVTKCTKNAVDVGNVTRCTKSDAPAPGFWQGAP